MPPESPVLHPRSQSIHQSVHHQPPLARHSPQNAHYAPAPAHGTHAHTQTDSRARRSLDRRTRVHRVADAFNTTMSVDTAAADCRPPIIMTTPPQHHRLPHTETATAKERRVSRACVSCRLRKTRCDLDYGGNPGIPPCRRCVREQKECVLATSRRGGRRPRKFVRLPQNDADAFPQQQQQQQRSDAVTAATACDAGSGGDPGTSSSATLREDQHMHHSTSPAESRHQNDGEPWSCSPEEDDGPSGKSASWPDSASQPDTPGGRSTRSLKSSGDFEGHITSSDLLNPSDALNLLAQVADLDGDERRDDMRHLSESDATGRDKCSPRKGSRKPSTPAAVHYPPISGGALSLPVASRLLTLYIDHFHPYFPVADKCILTHTPATVSSLIDSEPHLVTAIFTVASKDEPSMSRVHEACSRYMETLISKLIYKGSTTVGAVEALLILAQWAPQRLQEKPSIGRGEEDEGAWMQIGVAIRLGYLQSLEQTGLLSDKTSPSSETFRRKRLVWAACYMSDREVSIRVGKGFWSRGPGPSTIPRSADFPSLRIQEAGADNLGQLFQAQLELIQLFSNAHDILYSSSSHRAQLYLGGEYVRYIDDSFAVLRKWKIVWGSLNFTPLIKAGLNLSYEFLRLYINAFAFQATINRAITKARQQQQQHIQQTQQYHKQNQENKSAKGQTQNDGIETTPGSQAPASLPPPPPPPPPTTTISSPLFADLASTPDARFIYESMDAANSLLNILNSSVDSDTGLRYMPLKYYLYVIYAAVFLFKARLAGALGSEASESVQRSINVTIEALQRSSLSPHSLGQRYARLLSLLWRSKPQEQQQRSQPALQSNATIPGPDGHGIDAAAGGGGVAYPASGLHTATGPGSVSVQVPTVPSSTSTNNNTFGGLGAGIHADHHNQHYGGMSHGHAHWNMAAFPHQPDLLVRGFSWRDLDDLGQFIGPADMSFSDPTDLEVMGGSMNLDEGTAYDVLWPGNGVAF
ncbi:fungal specific transcription factor [Colletotrichum orchidophilum]|uniref:Fungal specific transcription factor n=1 Tax=Colletotrichum orchidophilum TaxID=1209926 RepID=A0A1G4AP98_9PEZI|nr:fungal specific transcription factor [Colletotrichum orchidophilum]OHE90915.1 fungal specific transcription factor [Colletotrichum orchidophilum]